MTPREKAIELINKYLQIYDGRVIEAKKCALIAVDEVLSIRYLLKKETWFYKEVRKEIIKS